MGVRFQTCPHVRLLSAIAGIALVFGGCGSEEENLKPDEGVSPFFTGKSEPAEGQKDVSPVTKPATPGETPEKPEATAALKPADGSAGSPPKSPANPAEEFSFESLDKLNKTAMSIGEKGQLAEAAKLFDQVLGAEPLNRTALFGRASVGTDLLGTLSDQDRIAEIGRDADLMRTLKKTYKPLNAREINALGIILFNEGAVLGSQGQVDTCLAVLKEAVDDGFTRWEMMEASPALKPVQADPRYRELLDRAKAGSLKIARARLKERLDYPISFPFEFKLKDPDGKVVSSADLKGKIVVVDFWGTWCGPCRKVIPHWIDMHRKYADRGLVIVGIAREHVEPEDAKTLVKNFVTEAGIPYICVMGDDQTEAQVPNFTGYPTVLILDQSGRVRFRSLGAEDAETQAADDAITILLDELNMKTKTKPAEAAKKP